MHQLWELAKHVIDAVFAFIAGITLIQILTLATSIMTFLGATLTVVWYVIRIREYLKTNKVKE